MQHSIRPQEALSEGLTAMLAHRRRSNNAWLVRGSALGTTGRAALAKSEPHGIIEVDDNIGQHRLEDVIIPLSQNPMPTDYLTMDHKLQQHISAALGMNDILAEAPSTRRSATEASIADSRHTSRAGAIKSVFEDAAVEIVRKCIGMAQNWLFAAEPLGEISGGKVNLSDADVATFENLASEREFRFDIRVGAIAPDVAKQHEITLILQQLMPVAGAGILDLRELLLEFLRSYGIEDPERFFTEQGPAQGQGQPLGQGQPPVAQGARGGPLQAVS